MQANSSLREGDVLMLLVHRSGKTAKEIAEELGIHPSSLSRLYNSEILTSKIKKKSALYFGVPESIFKEKNISLSEPVKYPLLLEQSPVLDHERPKIEEMSAIEVLRYLEEKDKRHYEERGRLLAIIENLTKK